MNDSVSEVLNLPLRPPWIHLIIQVAGFLIMIGIFYNKISVLENGVDRLSGDVKGLNQLYVLVATVQQQNIAQDHRLDVLETYRRP